MHGFHHGIILELDGAAAGSGGIDFNAGVAFNRLIASGKLTPAAGLAEESIGGDR